MLRLLVPVLLLIVGAAGGISAGLLMGSATEEGGADVVAAVTGAPAASDIGEDLEDGATAEGDTEFVRLNNQFVVPIVHLGSVRSLVVLALTIEVPAGENQAVFSREPRLRDAFLRALFAHANAGGFDGGFTEAAVMAPLRRSLREAARDILGDTARDVLIVDINRQDA